MTRYPLLLTLALACSTAPLTQAQTHAWRQLPLPSGNWQLITISTDGSKLAAADYYGHLHTSSNAGNNWTSCLHTATWQGLAGSADGQRLAAITGTGTELYRSTNGSASWESHPMPSALWSAMASSADCLKLVAAQGQNGTLYRSEDGGVTWSPLPAPQKNWRSLAMSADGNIIYAGADLGPGYTDRGTIHVSYDSGATWTETPSPSGPWQTIACSSDGIRAAAGLYGAGIYFTTNAGKTWTPANAPSGRWSQIASSADGQKMVAAPWMDHIYTSEDGGQTWTATESPVGQWESVACSADAGTVVAGQWEGSAYVMQPVSSLADGLPKLAMTLGTGTVTLTWPETAAEYRLEQSDTPSSTSAAWQTVSATPVVSAAPQPGTTVTQKQVTLSITGPQKFFRLVPSSPNTPSSSLVLK